MVKWTAQGHTATKLWSWIQSWVSMLSKHRFIYHHPPLPPYQATGSSQGKSPTENSGIAGMASMCKASSSLREHEVCLEHANKDTSEYNANDTLSINVLFYHQGIVRDVLFVPLYRWGKQGSER